MTITKIRIVLVNTKSKKEAKKIAHTLVEERLAASANLLPKIQSIYRWQNKIQDKNEFMLVLKTTDTCIPPLIQRVQSLHSYKVPKIIVLPIQQGYKPYLDWIRENTL